MLKKKTDAERRVHQACKVARALKLMFKIQAGPPKNSKILALEFSCSERTVYRDIQVLIEAGVSCSFDEYKQGYVISKGGVS